MGHISYISLYNIKVWGKEGAKDLDIALAKLVYYRRLIILCSSMRYITQEFKINFLEKP